MANKKIIVPAVALMLCALAFAGIGYAYTGTYTDQTNGTTSIDAHWVKVGSSEQISIASTSYKVDVDTASTRDETINTFSSTQPHGIKYVSETQVKIVKVKVGTINISASTSGERTGNLSYAFTPNSGNVTVSKNSETAVTFNLDSAASVDVYVDIVINIGALSSDSNTVVIPQITMTVTAQPASHSA